MKVDYNELAQEYAQHRNVHPEVLKALIEGGNLTADSRTLEVGCGTGNYTATIENMVGCSCWGIDPSEQMLTVAQSRVQNADLSIGRAEQLAHRDAFFDLVFSVDVIHHVVDRAAYFREAFRVLTPGGWVCTVTDSAEIIRQRQPLSVYFPESVAVELERYPRIATLRTLMEAAGFVNLRKQVVEFSYELTDSQAFRDKAFSSLHLISAEAYQNGVRSMENDLKTGTITGVSRYLLLWGTK